MLGGVNIGGGSTIYQIKTGTVSVNPGSIATVTRAATTFTVTGAATGDVLILNPPADLDDDLLFVGAAVTGANEGTVYLYNPTGGAIDDSARTWRYVLISFS
jgi:sarcosine oxidase gamma subunit